MERGVMKKIYVSVCKNVALSNLKQGKNDPPIRVSVGEYGRPKLFDAPVA
jgi:hypothetical protein